MQITLPVRKRLTIFHKKIILRSLPKGSMIEVHVGQMVTPETVLARYDVSTGFCIFHMKSLLGLSGSNLDKHLEKHIGQRVYTNEVIVRVKSFLPFGGKVFASPVDGTILSITPNGDMTISLMPQKKVSAALVWGTVSSIEDTPKEGSGFNLENDSMTIGIETNYLQFFGVMGSGKERQGRLLVACGNNEFLLPQKIDADFKDAVIVAGSLADHNLITRAVTLQASGIIAGGVHFKDAAAMGIRTTNTEGTGTDIGLSLLVVEGFGSIGINRQMFDLLQPYHGRFVLIDGNDQTLTVPLKETEMPNVAGLQANISHTVVAEKGQLVRITAGPDIGKTGTIESVGDVATRLASGIIAVPIRVKLDLESASQAAAIAGVATTQQQVVSTAETIVEVPSENLESIVYSQ